MNTTASQNWNTRNVCNLVKEYRFAAIARHGMDPHAVSGTYIEARSASEAWDIYRTTESHRFAEDTGKTIVCELWKN
jgi:hypothetical protein